MGHRAKADKLVQERYEKLVLGLRALDAAKEKQDTSTAGFGMLMA